MKLATLGESDRAAVETFLVQHRDSSMFLRSNLRRRGFEYTGGPFEAHYVAAFDGQRIVAVIGHTWNGMLIVQAPVHADPLAHAALKASGREVTGFSGPRDQVHRVRSALGLDCVKVRLDEKEDLYGLELALLQLPSIDPSAGIVCRPALPGDRAELLRFRLAYELEALGASDDEQTRTVCVQRGAAGHRAARRHLHAAGAARPPLREVRRRGTTRRCAPSRSRPRRALHRESQRGALLRSARFSQAE